MPCPKTEHCPLYPEFKLELSLRIWQTRYCLTDADYETCARYEMAESGTKLDPRMPPNGEFLGELQK